MLGAGGVRRDERQADGGGGNAGKLDLRLLRGLLQALHGHFIAAQVDALGLLEFVGEPVDHALVEVVAAQTVVAGGGEHFLYAVAHLDDRNVERAAAEVVHHDLLVVFFVDAVGERSRRGLVDDALYLKPGDLAGVLRGLPLRVSEIRGHRDHGLGHLAAEVGLGVVLQLGKDHRGNFLRGKGFVVDAHAVVAAHLALDAHYRAVRVRDGLALCHLAHHTLAGLAERHYGRRGARALGVGDHNGLAALDHCYAGVGST